MAKEGIIYISFNQDHATPLRVASSPRNERHPAWGQGSDGKGAVQDADHTTTATWKWHRA